MSTLSSSLSLGISSIQSGQYLVEQAATELAGIQSSEPGSEQLGQASGDQESYADVDVAENLLEMLAGLYEVKAGARVIETADEVLGTLIDTQA